MKKANRVTKATLKKNAKWIDLAKKVNDINNDLYRIESLARMVANSQKAYAKKLDGVNDNVARLSRDLRDATIAEKWDGAKVKAEALEIVGKAISSAWQEPKPQSPDECAHNDVDLVCWGCHKVVDAHHKC